MNIKKNMLITDFLFMDYENICHTYWTAWRYKFDSFLSILSFNTCSFPVVVTDENLSFNSSIYVWNLLSVYGCGGLNCLFSTSCFLLHIVDWCCGKFGALLVLDVGLWFIKEPTCLCKRTDPWKGITGERTGWLLTWWLPNDCLSSSTKVGWDRGAVLLWRLCINWFCEVWLKDPLKSLVRFSKLGNLWGNENSVFTIVDESLWRR